MDTNQINAPRPGFTVGLITGGIIGAVLALAFAPRAGADLKRSVASSPRNLGTAAADRYQDATARVSHAVDRLCNKVHADGEVADAVASGAHDAARLATSTKS